MKHKPLFLSFLPAVQLKFLKVHFLMLVLEMYSVCIQIFNLYTVLTSTEILLLMTQKNCEYFFLTAQQKVIF